MSKYRIVEVPTIYGPLYSVQERFLLFFWSERRLATSMKMAMSKIQDCKQQDNLPAERIVYKE